MKVEQKGHTTVLRDTQGDYKVFLEKVSANYNSYKEANLILDLSHNKNLDIKAVKAFGELSKMHKKSKKSLVIVVEEIDFNSVPVKMTVVPTLLEAHDIIEMEEIERDLGF